MEFNFDFELTGAASFAVCAASQEDIERAKALEARDAAMQDMQCSLCDGACSGACEDELED
jgi:hypothetical protein